MNKYDNLFNSEEVINYIFLALKEDVGPGDYSSLACISREKEETAQLIVKDNGVLAGVELAQKIFSIVDPKLKMNVLIKDGTKVKFGDIAFTVTGSAISILTGERLALNYMQRLSGVATIANIAAEEIKDYHAQVLDTRKTTPLMRTLEKWAVSMGGGTNHRMGLYDMIMLKDNHIDASGGIAKAVENTVNYLERKKLDLKIEVETRNLDEIQQALDTGKVDRIMFDNFSPAEMEKAVKLVDKRAETEASGGITLENMKDYAATGVDFISMGMLTHSVRSLDLSLKVVK